MKRMLRQIVGAMVVAILALSPGIVSLDPALAQDNGRSNADAGPSLSTAQLEQLVAPIALYPDSLLAQVLMAATYPLEVVSAARWSKANPQIHGKDLDAAMQQQTWDASVKSLTAFPQTLQMMNEKLEWTEKLGDAFLDQQKDTMDAVQRLRAKAHAQGNLVSSKEQSVKVESGSGSTYQTIIIEPAQPDVVYVPVYSPTVVYGAWPYPAAPPYEWYPPGYAVAGNIMSFGLGLAVGNALWGDFDWHHGDVNINVNDYRRYTHNSLPANWNANGGAWRHDPQHRRGVPYNNPAVANRYQGAHAGMVNQERAQAREAFRGHDGGNFPGHMQRPGAGGGGEQFHPGSNARPGSGGGGEQFHPRANVRPGSGGGGEQFHPGANTRPGAGGSGEHWGTGQNNRSAFQNMDRGQFANDDGFRGAGSRRIMSSHPDGGGFHGSGGVHGGGGFHGGGAMPRRR